MLRLQEHVSPIQQASSAACIPHCSDLGHWLPQSPGGALPKGVPQLQGVPAGPEGPNVLAELTDVAVVRAHDLHAHTSDGAAGVGGVLYAVDEGKALAVLWDGHLRAGVGDRDML